MTGVSGWQEGAQQCRDGLVFTVVGGTDAYRGVGGIVTVASAEIDGQEGFRTTFELTTR